MDKDISRCSRHRNVYFNIYWSCFHSATDPNKWWPLWRHSEYCTRTATAKCEFRPEVSYRMARYYIYKLTFRCISAAIFPQHQLGNLSQLAMCVQCNRWICNIRSGPRCILEKDLALIHNLSEGCHCFSVTVVSGLMWIHGPLHGIMLHMHMSLLNTHRHQGEGSGQIQAADHILESLARAM